MQKRIIVSILLSISLILISLGIVSYYHIEKSIERSYEERLDEARIIALSIDHILEENLTRLYDISLSDKIDLTDRTWLSETEALKEAYHYSLFSDGVFLLDRMGGVLLTYPLREDWSINLLGVPPVSKVITEMRPVISSIFTMEPARRKVIFALVPLRDRRGEIVGAAGGLIDPTTHHFSRILASITSEQRMNIDLVDSHGIVIASNRPASILTGIDHNRFLSKLIADRASARTTCHRCHEPDAGGRQRKTVDLLVFTPLSLAPWGVALRMPKDLVYAPSSALQRGFVLLGVVALGAAFVLALGMSWSIVKPVQQLIRASDRIARGDLAAPVAIESTDEIRTLSTHFDEMRTKLADSMENVQRQNLALEQRVQERTRQLLEKQVINETLLRKLITSQEDERKRIARELHDESLQTLAAVLMNIEMCRLHPELITPEKVAMMKDTVSQVISEMTTVIQNLRPTVLDDLGFEAALLWLVDRNLREKGVRCSMNLNGLQEDRLSPELQITLFRIFQEATMNVARHGEARNVYIHARSGGETFTMSIEDDGKGFDTGSVFEHMMTGRGLGILGMQERAAQVNGTLTVCSVPGQGTTLLCTVPLPREA